eukprot:2415411-Heterocapsa_arctica.AAC.1
MLVVSVYMIAGLELGLQSLELLEKLGRVLAMRDSPFIVGGDFNMNPSMLEDSGFLEMAGCSLLAPPSGLGTCKASAGTTSSIDYFLADKSLAAGVEMVEVCTE